PPPQSPLVTRLAQRVPPQQNELLPGQTRRSSCPIDVNSPLYSQIITYVTRCSSPQYAIASDLIRSSGSQIVIEAWSRSLSTDTQIEGHYDLDPEAHNTTSHQYMNVLTTDTQIEGHYDLDPNAQSPTSHQYMNIEVEANSELYQNLRDTIPASFDGCNLRIKINKPPMPAPRPLHNTPIQVTQI
ncbi:hypothetical protein DID78_04805, partial [Candidatus Marinamargulisbacteria bacterium SCGC AG-343-D04]